MKRIKANTHYRYGLDASTWATREVVGNLRVILCVECKGEYAYVSAYADVISGLGDVLGLYPSFGKDGEKLWQIEIRGSSAGYPAIHANSRERALGIFVDYLENELRRKEDMYP